MRRIRIVVVSGLSGSGKSNALAALEDLGYFGVDNLPPMFLPPMMKAFSDRKDVEQVAVGIDVRARGFLEDVAPAIAALRREGHEVRVLFLDCSDDELLRRFSATRRPHPLARGGDDVRESIVSERAATAPLRDIADLVLDTTHFDVHELRRELVHLFSAAAPLAPGLRIKIVSFGFRFGVPTDADMVLDVRFLPNPFFNDKLRMLTGLDDGVRDFVLHQEEAGAFLSRTDALLAYLLPLYDREGRAYLTIGVGCTGGQHRSVVIAEALGRRIRIGRNLRVVHRDIHRETPLGGPQAQGQHKEDS